MKVWKCNKGHSVSNEVTPSFCWKCKQTEPRGFIGFEEVVFKASKGGYSHSDSNCEYPLAIEMPVPLSNNFKKALDQATADGFISLCICGGKEMISFNGVCEPIEDKMELYKYLKNKKEREEMSESRKVDLVEFSDGKSLGRIHFSNGDFLEGYAKSMRDFLDGLSPDVHKSVEHYLFGIDE